MLQFHRKFSTIVQNQSALSDATAAAATGAMLTAMACCPLPTGRGPWQRPRRVTEASLSALRRYREGAQVVETRGATDPVACATILLVCFSFSLLVPTARSAPPPRAACRSIRLLCVLTAYLPSVRLAVWLRLFAGARVGTGGASEVVVGVFSRPPRSRRRTTRCWWRRCLSAPSEVQPGSDR